MALVQKREKDERSVLTFCEVRQREGAMEQFFDLVLAAV